MINIVRSEFIKLRTILAHWVLLIIAVAFPLVVVTLVALFGELDFGLDSGEVASLIVGLTVVSAMLLGSMSAISLTADFGHSTIRPTYAATPDRLRVMAGKILVNSGVVLVVGAFAVAGSWVIASVILSARDHPVSLGDDGVTASLVSVIVLVLIVTLFGFGLALVIRNSPATVTILLLWPLLIEGLIAVVLSVTGVSRASKWLPYQAAISAAGNDSNSPDQLGRPMGLIYFAVVAAAIVGFGAWLDGRRDA